MSTSFKPWMWLSILLIPWIVLAENPASIGHEQKTIPQILVFVSFSMPTASLAAIVHDAQQQGAQVVLRGLVDHSFKSTFVRLGEVLKQAGGGGMQLDPLAFERYHVTRVPTVVVLNTVGNPNEVETIAGDIPLAGLLTAIRNHREESSTGSHSFL